LAPLLYAVRLFNARLFMGTLLMLLFVCPAMAQNDDEPEQDSIKLNTEGISDKLKAMVEYSTADSMYFDLENQIIYLWDSAKVVYQSTTVKAHYIEIDFKNNIILAVGRKDSVGYTFEKVEFAEGSQTYYADKIRYNYLTGKGKISEAATIDGESHIIGEAVKKDSTVFFIYNGQYTTCDLEHPHFSIRARKLKIIQNDKIVTGPAYLEISDVPTPLAVPFGFFPNKKQRTSGILIPTYGESPQLGFFLRDGGYYWGASDKFDLALRGDIYSRGSWGAKIISNYNVRYKYTGNISTRFSRIITGDTELPTSQTRNDFFVIWTHRQDPKSNPGVNFSASVNAGTSTYNQNNATVANNYLANTFQSNIAWSKSWKYLTLATNLRHSQNTQTGIVDMTLPQVALTSSRIYPFRSKNRIGSKWYDKIGFSYTADMQNLLSVQDRELSLNNFNNLGPKFRNGIRQTLPVSTNLNVLKYFTLTPQLNLNSVTQFRTIEKTWNPADSSIVTDTINGARANLDWNAALTLGTRFFGTFAMRKGKFNVIRHTVTPNITLSYMPDYTNSKYGFWKEVQSNTFGAVQKYSIFEGGVYGSSPAGRIGSIGLNLQNNLEGKLRPQNDTASASGAASRRMLIDALNFSISYNMIAETFKWSPLTVNFRTKLFRIIDVNTTFVADPYRVSENGVRINRFEWRTGKRLARLTSSTLILGTSLRPGGFTSQSGNTPRQSALATQSELEYINANPNQFVDFNIPWSLNVGYNLTWSRPLLTQNVTQAINLSGDINMTPKWKVGFNSNYDLERGEFGYTQFTLYRDLHCWEMQFNWIPFGFRQSYNITIQVKAAALNDLKLTRKRDWFDFTGQ
jgi:hypothetical protein